MVRWSDKIAYLGRDLEDALMLGLLQKRQVPKVVRERLGVTNRSVINALITDLLEHSTDQVLSVSAQIHRALNFLYTFNMNRIYRSGKATASHAQVRRAMKPLFELIEEKIAGFQKSGRLPPRPSQEQRRESVATVDVLTDFLRKDVRNWRQEKPARLALDFVAGMTDSFFVATVNELFFPRGVS